MFVSGWIYRSATRLNTMLTQRVCVCQRVELPSIFTKLIQLMHMPVYLLEKDDASPYLTVHPTYLNLKKNLFALNLFSFYFSFSSYTILATAFLFASTLHSVASKQQQESVSQPSVVIVNALRAKSNRYVFALIVHTTEKPTQLNSWFQFQFPCLCFCYFCVFCF